MTTSLRRRAVQISAGAYVIASSIVLTSFVFISVAKQSSQQKEIQKNLLKTASSQIEQLIPSFLLPEQQSGLALLLSKFKEAEELSYVKVIKEEKEIPESFASCKLSQTDGTSCIGQDGREIAVIAPITESGQLFGHLLKAKPTQNPILMHDLFQTVAIFSVMLLFIFIAIHMLISQLLSKTLPRALQQLVDWIETDLSESKTKLAKLPFSELEILREKISEVMERHDRERDQILIGQLTSGVLHDLKTAIHSVSISTYLATEQKGSEKYSKRCESLHQVCSTQLPKIQSIVDSVLDGTRQIALNRRKASILETIKSSVRSVEEVARSRNVEVRVPEQDYSITHDPSQLERALTNLIKNGIEAFDRSVDDGDKLVNIEVESSGAELKVIVSDNGPGLTIDPKKLFRSMKTTKPYGTGLGLMVSRKIVEAHHGTIQFHSSGSERCTKFVVALPGGET